MSDTEETFCRLCAEPTPKEQLIFADEDVAVTSKILTKMEWINVDISTSNPLPTTICFSCFDLLERTWSFLHNVRSAQVKLTEIFAPKVDEKTHLTDVKPHDVDAGKPIDSNWEEFETKANVKDDPENGTIRIIGAIESGSLVGVDLAPIIKAERDSSDMCDRDGFHSTDSDVPLHTAVKKKKIKKKKRVNFDTEILEADLLKTEIEAVPIDLDAINMTWDDYMCRCGNCDALCKNINSLQLHSLQIHSSCCTFKCSDCNKIFTNFRAFINHVRIHKKVLRYCCEYCNKHYSMTSYLKRHRQTVHCSLKSCSNCGLNFESDDLLHDHLIIYSKGCKKNKKREKLEFGLKCTECHKEFKSRSNLQQHKLVHTQRNREFSCHICGKMFFTKGTLSAHMMTHEETKPYKCEFCTMSFRARGNLQSHISLHSGMKPFVCEQCGKSFRVKRHLKSHSIVHTDLRPYVCQYCNKSFRFKTRLNLHVRQHTGAKPYNCIYCQRDFTNGSNFKKHMMRRHNIDTSKKKYSIVEDLEGDTSIGVQS